MDDKGNLRSDLKLPKDTEDDNVLSKRMRSLLDDGAEVLVTVLAAMGIEKIVDCKEQQ